MTIEQFWADIWANAPGLVMALVIWQSYKLLSDRYNSLLERNLATESSRNDSVLAALRDVSSILTGVRDSLISLRQETVEGHGSIRECIDGLTDAQQAMVTDFASHKTRMEEPTRKAK